jgi:ketosteroid isomerase-like protein
VSSETNVELLREFWRTWKVKGGAGLVERYDEFFTENAEWRPPTRELTGARYVGREGLAQYVRDIARVITDLEGELEEITEIAPGVVRSTVQMHAHGKVSGVTIDAPMIGIAKVEDGRISLAWASYDPEAAERAAEAIIHGERVPA